MRENELLRQQLAGGGGGGGLDAIFTLGGAGGAARMELVLETGCWTGGG